MNAIRPKKRRKLGPLKRSKRLTLNFTEMEFEELERKAATAGMTMAVLVRKMSLGAPVIARLEPEDRQLFRGVVNASNALSGLLLLAKGKGDESLSRVFESARAEVDTLLNKIRI